MKVLIQTVRPSSSSSSSFLFSIIKTKKYTPQKKQKKSWDGERIINPFFLSSVNLWLLDALKTPFRAIKFVFVLICERSVARNISVVLRVSGLCCGVSLEPLEEEEEEKEEEEEEEEKGEDKKENKKVFEEEEEEEEEEKEGERT